jgi:hypothetical protein
MFQDGLGLSKEGSQGGRAKNPRNGSIFTRRRNLRALKGGGERGIKSSEFVK